MYRSKYFAGIWPVCDGGDKFMDSVLSVLSPENIQKNEYEEIIRDIRSQLQSLSDSRRFRQLLDKYADKPYYFKRNGNYLENKRCTPTIRDAACFMY